MWLLYLLIPGIGTHQEASGDEDEDEDEVEKEALQYIHTREDIGSQRPMQLSHPGSEMPYIILP